MANLRKLQELISSAGLIVSQVERKSGLSSHSIGRIIKYNSCVTSSLEKICGTLGVSPCVVFDDGYEEKCEKARKYDKLMSDASRLSTESGAITPLADNAFSDTQEEISDDKQIGVSDITQVATTGGIQGETADVSIVKDKTGCDYVFDGKHDICDYLIYKILQSCDKMFGEVAHYKERLESISDISNNKAK